MDRLTAMQAYVRVVEAGTFTKAADSLDLPKATVTRLIQTLETHLRTKLLNRTTRRVTVTPDGAAYYERATRLLSDLEELEGSMNQARVTPRGRIRIDVPGVVGREMIIPHLPEFYAKYPDIQIELGVSDRTADLIGDNIDCVIRGGELTDQSLVARRIAEFRFISCATPEYLRRHGMPAHPRELGEAPHRMVGYFSARSGKVVPDIFRRGDETVEIVGNHIVAVNDASAYLNAGLAHLGVVQLTCFMAGPLLKSGELVRVLEDWDAEPLPVYVVYPPNRHLSSRLRVFVDWVVELIGREAMGDVKLRSTS
ncbi:LysR family transcriptional regulator [Pelomonas aquatica]|jgi:LysR family transcriptional regulator for bpeEF and oprC|uniref:LysR family transcriptional regulator n=1 Tax=Pelomonas aquatica TaxID=431058 RepID=A0A9X4LPV7_9BURK|nr:LysR family transcriptional regulator [Pelomonas aquatica]MCY4752894.1 LysR family transcriptional regulator [Pelomonas aquatica]MDG0864278.1 LysR family transcriptional regulator [Pelomonas aquatica]